MRFGFIDVFCPRLEGCAACEWEFLNPRCDFAFSGILVREAGETQVASHIKSVEREVYGLDVSSAQSKLELGSWKEDVWNNNGERGISDLFYLKLGLIVITGRAFGKLCDKPAVEFECFYIVRTLLPLTVLE